MRVNRTLAFAFCAAIAVMSVLAAPAHAVMLYRTPSRNTAQPAGSLWQSGWQWEGNFGNFTGTTIAPRYFLTAGHIGGYVGQTFSWGGKTYKTTAMYDDPSSDLRIWKVDGSFWSYAPIYTGTAETGKTMVTIGRGTQRGAAVTKNNVTKGWKFGTNDHVRSWGTNVATGVMYNGAANGYLLKFAFNRTGLYDEGTLSVGDSGGGVFVKDTDGKWKVAGINYLIDGPFSTTGGSDPGFSAGIFDKGGLYTKSGSTWTMNYDSVTDLPANWYATRVSSRSAWIKGIINSGTTSALSVASTSGSTMPLPEPASITAILFGAATLLGRRRRR